MSQTDQEQQALDEAVKLTTKLLGTSADDTGTSLMLQAENRPGQLLMDVSMALTIMNKERIEKKSHRQAMIRAGRKALNTIGELPRGTENRN